jgi:aspartate 1-decarboxylase
MLLTMLKAKVHRATVTNTDLEYEGSITIDAGICEEAGIREFEQVDVFNTATGSRFTTYVLLGKEREIQVNGAAARLVQKNDKVIICSYAQLAENEIGAHHPKVVLMRDDNTIGPNVEPPGVG